jgi:triphosphoribosyl-dephospho-CoA synthase
MSEFPDSLIARKCGEAVARQSAALAAAALAAGQPSDADYLRAVADLDFWLRADGHRRNPGTTADLLAAGLFASLLSGVIQLPVRFY